MDQCFNPNSVSMALWVPFTLLLVASSLSISHYGVGGRSISKEEDIELERQLKGLNKPPIETIQTKEGDIIDCIDIYKQPAFDHPLLKNHKIQMRPTSRPKGLIDETSSVDNLSRSTLRSIVCPQQTIPILRTRKEFLIRSKSFSNSFAASIHPHTPDSPGRHSARLRSFDDPNKIYSGIGAIINTYNPTIQETDQITIANMALMNGPPNERNALWAGWMVAPGVLGDNKTHIFIFWTVDGGLKTGCFNLFCNGFIEVDSKHIIGEVVDPVSTYDGPQYDTKMMIFQDPPTGHWWLLIDDVNVGYWPKELVPHLVRGASIVSWGGEVLGPLDKDSPPMGNGHFPDNYHNHRACWFRQLKVVNTSNYLVNPEEGRMGKYVDTTICYNLEYYGFQKDLWGGHTFLFGGPGGACGV